MTSQAIPDARTEICFLGTGTVTPQAGRDTACVLLNGTVLVDTGWNAAINMLQYGYEPLAVNTVFITHCHHDHYIGLPQLLFYHAMRGKRDTADRPFTVVGPRPDVRMIVERALAFLRHDQYGKTIRPPEIIPLQAGDPIETERFAVTTAPTVHPVVGLCYRFHDKASGATVVITGDTAYHPPLADHADGADLLIHEASRGPTASHPNDCGGHSGAVDAANIARAAGVGQLALIHYPPARRKEILTAAQAVFPDTTAPVEGDRIALPATADGKE